MTTLQTDIKSQIAAIVSRCTGFPLDALELAQWQEPLTGHTFNLSAVDLIYILFEIEEKFHIQIPPISFEQYGFNSLNSICSVVQDILEHA